MVSSLMMRISVLLLMVGMVGGLAMGAHQNFMLAPAHAHLNLIGGVLMFLFGLYYRVVPAAGASTLAKIQAAVHIFGAIYFPIGIVMVLTRGPSVEILPITGGITVLTAVALFAIIVFRTSRA